MRTAPKPSRFGGTPTRRARSCVTLAASSWAITRSPTPLCAITRVNSPCAEGIASSVVTAIAPADWPKIVTSLRVAAERGDVLLDPPQRRHDVEQAAVGRRVVEQQEAVDAQPVVERHADGAVAGEGAAVVGRDRAAAVAVRAAVDPHQHGQALAAALGGPDVEVEAVLALDDGLLEDAGERQPVGRLRHRRPEARRVADALPRLRRRGRLEAQRAERRRRVRQPLVGRDAVLDGAADAALRDL